MYVCMYVCMYVMYVCIYVCMYVCMYVCVYLYREFDLQYHNKGWRLGTYFHDSRMFDPSWSRASKLNLGITSWGVVQAEGEIKEG